MRKASALLPFLQRHNSTLAALIAFLLPIKLSLALIVLITAIIANLVCDRRWLREALEFETALAPLAIFIAYCLISGLFGIAPLRSIEETVGFAFYALTIPYFISRARDGNSKPILAALIAGQTLAGIHTAFDSAANWDFPKFFPGRVTESGQLVVTAFALWAYVTVRMQNNDSIKKSWAAISVLVTTALTATAFIPRFWPNHSNWQLTAPAALLAVSAVVFMARDWITTRAISNQTTVTAAAPFLLTALIANLKRGPWSGIAVGALFILWKKHRRLILPVAAIALALAIGVDPIRDRLAESSASFFVAGGRNTIWQIALELSLRFPLGIGFGNAPFLRQFSADIPAGLTHFHSNILNTLAETGWIGLALIGWWLLTSFRQLANSKAASPYPLAAAAMLLAWQVAGIVEYNMGDKEVLLLAFMFIGLGLGAARTKPS